MGHHIDAEGRFQSDKHPDLPPDRIRLNLANPRSHRALRVLAQDYEDHDPELAQDITLRLDALHGPMDLPFQAIYGLQDPPLDHSMHGRGTDGPDDPDCACRGGVHERACAAAGCGFCKVAQTAHAEG